MKHLTFSQRYPSLTPGEIKQLEREIASEVIGADEIVTVEEQNSWPEDDNSKWEKEAINDSKAEQRIKLHALLFPGEAK